MWVGVREEGVQIAEVTDVNVGMPRHSDDI